MDINLDLSTGLSCSLGLASCHALGDLTNCKEIVVVKNKCDK